MNTKGFTIDDLPKFSPWPARLLGLVPWQQRQKTAVEVKREYEHEKWGPLLARVRASDPPVTLQDIDDWVLRDIPSSLCSINERLECLSPREGHDVYLNIVEETLAHYLPTPALVELGAGYGSIILALAKRQRFRHMKIIAGEYTASGIELLGILAKAQQTSLVAGHCDFASEDVVKFSVPSDSAIFTSFAAHYVPRLSFCFIRGVLALQPRVVVHFEPCYEHCEPDSLLGLMRRRYIEVNDYNTNLISLLRTGEQGGYLRILLESRAVFGLNPLLPASIVAWAPCPSPHQRLPAHGGQKSSSME